LQLCGRDDFFLDDNRRFATLAGQYNADLRYRELPGVHDWGTWDAMLPQMIAWFRPDKPSP
jgi:S-formylglutathione hydrolase FrmB